MTALCEHKILFILIICLDSYGALFIWAFGPQIILGTVLQVFSTDDAALQL